MFQSLSGFQVRCNAAVDRSGNGRTRLVSIPIGFSSSLQLHFRWRQAVVEEVSIPIGFSSSLQLDQHSGLRDKGEEVSIPIGFSSSLQLTQQCGDRAIHHGVSIPIGFSSSLQHPK